MRWYCRRPHRVAPAAAWFGVLFVCIPIGLHPQQNDPGQEFWDLHPNFSRLAPHVVAVVSMMSGDTIGIARRYFRVVGVPRAQGLDTQSPSSSAWRDIGEDALVPLSPLSGRVVDVVPHKLVDEIWLQVVDGTRVDEVARIFAHTLTSLAGVKAGFDIIVPRELLAQRHLTPRTFSGVVGGIAAISLIVGASES